jgi:hypothetical protein
LIDNALEKRPKGLQQTHDNILHDFRGASIDLVSQQRFLAAPPIE